MARRPLNDEPISALAAWSSRLAIFALAVAAISVIILRSSFLEIEPSLATFAASLVFAVAAILLALASFISIWRNGLRGLSRSLLGLVLGTALLAYPAYLAQRAYRYPAIADISTDANNPPRFISLAAQRPKDRIAYSSVAAPLQRAAYPDIVPLQLTLPLRSSYDVVVGVLNKRKQPFTESMQPTVNRREATIEYTARTPLMGFRDDVVIRVTAVGSGSRIDMRSASRFGPHDFGNNATRLRALLEEVDEASGNAPEPKPEPVVPEKKPPPKRPAQKPKS
ncbi:MAG: DUF1499 domain-containing protein [Pseudolabrys sp.]|nr:DUF1499 domain-containing protein [Pseudolabrys sp.]